jgi:CRISPR-associated protein Cas5d
MRYRNTVEFMVYGEYALFSDPITRVGGEKFTYQIPTYQAMKGVLESIYWKPTIIWYIDEVRVMNKIQTQSKGVRPIKYAVPGNDLAYYTYLKDVCYQVRAHFDWNMNRPELEDDRNENKHHCIAKRMIERGGRRDTFLGTRECQAYVRPYSFGEGIGFYDDYGELSFGLMVHGFDYPDETGRDEMCVRLWKNAIMKNGRILYPLPFEDNSEIVRRYIKPMKKKEFVFGINYYGLNEPGFEMFSCIGGENT